MPVATDIIKLAESQLGYVEQGGPHGNDGNLTKYNNWYFGSVQAQPWCATFVSWVFFMAGLPLPASTSKGFAYTPSGAAWFQKQGRWSKTPRVGALVFFSWEGKRIDHVAIVVKVNSDGSITTIEGNTSSGTAGSQRDGGGVYRRIRKSNIVGYGLPLYKEDAPTSTPAPGEVKDVEKFFVIYKEGDAGRFAWWPVINRKTFISGHAAEKFFKNPNYLGDLEIQASELEGIKNLADA